MRIAVVSIAYSPVSREPLQRLFDALYESGTDICLYAPFSELIRDEIMLYGKISTFTDDTLPAVDYVFSVGGDGTLLHAVGIVKDSGIPILGINTGRLGYLTSASVNEIRDVIGALRAGDISIEHRTLLRLDTKGNCFGGFNRALNDFTIHKKDSSSMITVHAKVNGVFLNSYWGDGLIISTPTGSTAYSLSCGGPIVAPECDVFIITPIAPHNLNVRPLVIPSDSIITLAAETRNQNYLVSLDSRSASIDCPAEFVIQRESFRVNTVRLSAQTFPATIRGKLLWGSDIRN